MVQMGVYKTLSRSAYMTMHFPYCGLCCIIGNIRGVQTHLVQPVGALLVMRAVQQFPQPRQELLRHPGPKGPAKKSSANQEFRRSIFEHDEPNILIVPCPTGISAVPTCKHNFDASTRNKCRI